MSYTLHADSYTTIGLMHESHGESCQDYAAVEVDSLAAYATLSDGCSSGGATDIGSRVIVKTTMHALKQATPNWLLVGADVRDAIPLQRTQHLENVRDVLDLSQRDLLATSLCAVASGTRFVVLVEGDGVVVTKSVSGALRLRKYEWDKNMPYYPAYRLGLLHDFIAAHGSDPHAKRLTVETVVVSEDGEVHEPEYETLSLKDGVAGVLEEGSLDDVCLVGLFSDGIAQVSDVDWVQAVQVALAYKTQGGSFAKRRMIRQMKTWRKDGCAPNDDVSCAVILIDKEMDDAEEEHQS